MPAVLVLVLEKLLCFFIKKKIKALILARGKKEAVKFIRQYLIRGLKMAKKKNPNVNGAFEKIIKDIERLPDDRILEAVTEPDVFLIKLIGQRFLLRPLGDVLKSLEKTKVNKPRVNTSTKLTPKENILGKDIKLNEKIDSRNSLFDNLTPGDQFEIELQRVWSFIKI